MNAQDKMTDRPLTLKGKRIFVAGHNGLVGSALLRRLAREEADLLTVGRSEVDLRDQAAVNRWMAAERPDLNIGWNEPYAALNGVTLTLEKHGDGRGLEATMIEIRNDEILEPEGVELWAGLVARSLERARQAR